MRRRVLPTFVLLNAIKSISDCNLELLRDALSATADGIRRCSARIDKAYHTGSDEYGEAVLEQEIGIVEALLGCAFVLCQVYVTQVVANVSALHEHARKHGQALTPTSGKKKDIKMHIIRSCCRPVGGSSVTEIEAIDSLANYFKHRDEWVGDWAALTGQQKVTAEIVSAIGLVRGSTENMRAGAEALGNQVYASVERFAEILADWRTTVLSGYENELRCK